MTNQTAWTNAASTVEYSVHIGTWINWTRGQVMGATLTLDRRDGTLLIAFTAVFVGIVTERLWRIACILFYRCYSSPEPRDALYHQQQAILRNSTSPVSAVWTLSQLLWTWQNVATHCVSRILPTLLAAILCLCAFTIAGGFSSSISSGISNEILLNGTNCGSITRVSSDPESRHFTDPYTSQLTHSAASYAQHCYSSDTPGVFDCTSFAKGHLSSIVDDHAPCPFRNNTICRSNTSNIRLDTGYIDLDKDLGVNATPDQNLLFRSVLHCAPLVTQGYTESIRGSRGNFTTYKYGSSFGSSFLNGHNFTYMVESLDSQYNRQGENPYRGAGRSFIVVNTANTVFRHEEYTEYEGFTTIPALFDPDGETTLIFLSGNGLGFYEPTGDPWYRATTPGDKVASPGMDGQNLVYQPEEAASPMGCVQRYQFCNPSIPKDSCGPLASWGDAQVEAAPLFGLTDSDDYNENSTESSAISSRFIWLTQVLSDADVNIGAVIRHLGPNALTSLKSLSNGLVGRLPDNQWQLDVSFWWATYLASLQAALVNAAYGPTDPALNPYKVSPFNSHVRDMCNNQRIRSTRHVSFSLFGLYFTLVAGILILVTSYILEPIFECLYRRQKYREYTFLEWTASETLQLQRMGFQGVGSGAWSGYTDNIPRTKQDEALTGLALAYPLEADESRSQNQEKMNGNMTGTAGTRIQDQDPDTASLDDLLDGSESQAGSQNSSSPGSS